MNQRALDIRATARIVNADIRPPPPGAGIADDDEDEEEEEEGGRIAAVVRRRRRGGRWAVGALAFRACFLREG